MRHDRPYSIPLILEHSVLSKTYDREKLNEDLEVGCRGLYQDNGYFKAVCGDPSSKYRHHRFPHRAFRSPAAATEKPSISQFLSKKASATRWHAKNRCADPDKDLSS